LEGAVTRILCLPGGNSGLFQRFNRFVTIAATVVDFPVPGGP
jgi:hypothetical protein